MGNGMKFRECFRVATDIFQSISFSSNSPSQLLEYAQESTYMKKTNQKIYRLIQLVSLQRVAHYSRSGFRTTQQDLRSVPA